MAERAAGGMEAGWVAKWHINNVMASMPGISQADQLLYWFAFLPGHCRILSLSGDLLHTGSVPCASSMLIPGMLFPVYNTRGHI